MEKIFNAILIISVLIALYFCIQKYKKETNSGLEQISEEKIIEKFNIDKSYYNSSIEPQTIKFDYGLRDIDKQFLKEQEFGASLKSWYPNSWIESFDSVTGEPIYNSRVTETFIEPKARFSYEFNATKTTQMDGIVDPNDFIDGKGKTLKEVYDSSFVDFKKLYPKKTLISDEKEMGRDASSNLSFDLPDTWVYENENPNNGGQIIDNLYASDPYTNDSVANYTNTNSFTFPIDSKFTDNQPIFTNGQQLIPLSNQIDGDGNGTGYVDGESIYYNYPTGETIYSNYPKSETNK